MPIGALLPCGVVVADAVRPRHVPQHDACDVVRRLQRVHAGAQVPRLRHRDTPRSVPRGVLLHGWQREWHGGAVPRGFLLHCRPVVPDGVCRGYVHPDARRVSVRDVPVPHVLLERAGDASELPRGVLLPGRHVNSGAVCVPGG